MMSDLTSVSRPTRALLCALLAVGTCLDGCGPRHSYIDVQPPVTIPANFHHALSDGAEEADPAPELDEMDRWWRSFEDEELETMVEQLLAQNLDLRVA